MKKIQLILVFFISCQMMHAQKTSFVYLPPKSSAMPEWMNIFYSGVRNAHDLESAYEKYYETHPFEKSTYTQYYKRWMRENERYIQEDGTLLFPENTPAKQQESKNEIQNSTGNWTLVGPIETFEPAWVDVAQPSIPWQVNIYAFDIAPTNPDVLYACPETGGVFKTVDKGLNWFSVSDNIRLGAFSSVAIDPTNQDIVYISNQQDVYKTIDGGVSWTNIYSTPSLNSNDIAIFQNDPNVILIAGGSGVYKSVNAGAFFNLMAGVSGIIYDIETNPLRDSSVYVLCKTLGDSLVRFYRSYDAGFSFSAVNAGWISGASESGRMTVTPADTNYIYAVLLMEGSLTIPVILRSTDAGSNWTHTCSGTQIYFGDNSSPLGMSNGQHYYDLSIQASTINPAEVIVGTTSAYKSVDTANTFTPFGGYLGDFLIHPDIQEMKMIGNDAWISTDGGLTYSTDFFTNISNASSRTKGIYASDFWGYGQGWNEDLATGGRYHNGDVAMYDGYPIDKTLSLWGSELGTGYAFVGKDMYIANSDVGAYIMPRTFSGNKTDFIFSLYPNEDGGGFDASEMESYPDCFNHIYIGNSNSLWKSEDGAMSYAEIHNFNERVKKFEICRSNPLVMYLATEYSLYKTIDGGLTWTALTLPSGQSISRLSMSVSFTDENVLWIASPYNPSNARVFKTVDGGGSWINLTTAMINGYNYSVINHQAGTDGGVYISSGDYAQVFYRNNTMPDWMNYSTGLPVEYRPVNTKPFYKKNKLRSAGSRGIWEVDFYEDGLPVAQPTVDKLESSCVRDTFYFDDFSAVNHALVNWQWSFPGASYVSATTIRNPKVKYPSTGTYTATLTVTQNGNVSNKSVSITISGNNCEADSLPGSALTLSNDGDYASVPALYLNSNTITISCWVKPDSIQNNWAGVIFCRGGTSCSGISVLDDLELRYHWKADHYGFSTGLYIIPNAWNHVALVVTPTSATVYLNGIASTDTGVFTPELFDALTLIGEDAISTGRTFHGLIDEVCFWNRALTTDEIRAMRHLTKIPSSDPGLVAYYQFNEPGGLVLDRSGVKHAFLSAGASRVVSTGPFAGGVSSKLTVASGGIFTFPGTDLTLAFPAAGGSTYPDGDLWVSKLNCNPDQNANPYPMVSKYWVVNNYWCNSSFSVLDSINFEGLPQLSITTANNYYLYTREANEDGSTWGNPHDTADVYNLNGANSSLNFSNNNNIISFGQLSLNTLNSTVSIQEPESTGSFNVNAYPNPTKNELYLDLNSSKDCKNTTISMYNDIGKLVLSSNHKIKMGENRILLNLASFPNGIYILSVEIDRSKNAQQIVIHK